MPGGGRLRLVNQPVRLDLHTARRADKDHHGMWPLSFLVGMLGRSEQTPQPIDGCRFCGMEQGQVAAGVSNPVTASPHPLALSPREPMPNQLAFGCPGTEPQTELHRLVCCAGHLRSEANTLHIAGTEAAQLCRGGVGVHQSPQPEAKFLYPT